MHQNKQEKSFKIYRSLFVIAALFTIYLYYNDYGKDFLIKPRFILSILFYLLLYYFGVAKNNIWVWLMVKFIVWLNIIALVVYLLAITLS